MVNFKWWHILKILGMTIMLTAFVLVPERYPWYYELLLFNVGTLTWLFSKHHLKKKQNLLTKLKND